MVKFRVDLEIIPEQIKDLVFDLMRFGIDREFALKIKNGVVRKKATNLMVVVSQKQLASFYREFSMLHETYHTVRLVHIEKLVDELTEFDISEWSQSNDEV